MIRYSLQFCSLNLGKENVTFYVSYRVIFSLTILFTNLFFNLDFRWRQQNCTEYSLSSDASFCYTCFVVSRKFDWLAEVLAIHKSWKSVNALLKSSVLTIQKVCKTSPFLFMFIYFVVWSRFSLLNGFDCLKGFLKIIMCVLISLRRKFTFPVYIWSSVTVK